MARTRIVRRQSRINDKAEKVTDVFECLNGELDGQIKVLWSAPAEGYSGLYAPRPMEIAGIRNADGKTGSAQIVAKYRTLTVREYMERHPNIAVLLGRGASRGVPATMNEKDEVVAGPDVDDTTGQTVWQIVKGKPIIEESLCEFIVRACTDKQYQYLYDYVDSLGCVNSNSMSMFGTGFSRPGRLLFNGISWYTSQYTRILYWIDYHFLGRMVGWRGEGGWGYVSRKLKKIVVDVPYYDSAGTEQGTRPVMTLKFDTTGDYQRVGPDYPTCSFRDLNEMLVWRGTW